MEIHQEEFKIMSHKKSVLLSLILLLIINGCASYTTRRTHPDFLKRRESIMAIAVAPPVVYYGKKSPGIPIGKTGISIGEEDIETKPDLEQKVRKNIEDACWNILKGSRFHLSGFIASDSLFETDTTLAVALENSLREVEKIVHEVRRIKAGSNLKMMMKSDCSYLGSKMKASHLLFVWCSGWETTFMDELVPTLLGGAEDYQSEGLYIAMFLVDVLTGEVIWYKDTDQPHNTGYPVYTSVYQGTKAEDVQGLVRKLLNSLLVVKK